MLLFAGRSACEVMRIGDLWNYSGDRHTLELADAVPHRERSAARCKRPDSGQKSSLDLR